MADYGLDNDQYWGNNPYSGGPSQPVSNVGGGEAGGGSKELGQAATMTGNPYVMGAGLALQAYAAQKDRQLANQKANYESAMQKQQMRMQAAAAGMQAIDRMGLA